ncbi:hypothetical protein CU311_02380 [Prochlorococcus marinus str. MU1402]|uniref:hypothetical protein n=1 Tax=Prochlorococcus marinus TaxID=1219 RepID=UPI001ADB65C6|nr:hypothetical protein [Prochlorococcus marinus]MBO8231492.1 hypothetical protein [Prochlorococcus marinus XMU1402]MBW3056251.1 hypothetical protein [Prochlorococcus marinus str. MU1402]
MILKKKEFFLLIFLTLLQSCSGGRIGNFLESSFNDLEKISQVDDSQKNLLKNNVVEKNIEINKKNYEKTKKEEKPKTKNALENKRDIVKENIEINKKNYEKIKKEEKPKTKNDLEEKKYKNLEKFQKQKNIKIKNSSKKRKIELQSYKIIFILKDADPKDPTKDLSSILRNSEVNFEIEKIERILDSKNKNMNKD